MLITGFLAAGIPLSIQWHNQWRRSHLGEQLAPMIKNAEGEDAQSVQSASVTRYGPPQPITRGSLLPIVVNNHVFLLQSGVKQVHVWVVPKSKINVTVTTPSGSETRNSQQSSQNGQDASNSPQPTDGIDLEVMGNNWTVNLPVEQIHVDVADPTFYAVHMLATWGAGWQALRFDVQLSIPQRSSYEQSVFGLRGDEPAQFVERLGTLLADSGAGADASKAAELAIKRLQALPGELLARRWLAMDAATLRGCRDVDSAAEDAMIIRGKLLNAFPTTGKVLTAETSRGILYVRDDTHGDETVHYVIDAFAKSGAAEWTATLRAERGHLSVEQAAEFASHCWGDRR